MKWLLGGALLLVALVTLATMLRGREWNAAEHQRNYGQLTLVAKALEGWPSAMQRMARGHFLPNRVEFPPDSQARSAGWQAAVRTNNPEVGPITILYKMASTKGKDCPRDETVTVAIRSQKAMLSGRIPASALWHADQSMRKPASETPQFEAKDLGTMLKAYALPTLQPAASKGDCFQLEWQAALQIDQLANRADNAPGMDSILVIDSRGQVVASIGGSAPPVVNISQFLQQDDDFQAVLSGLQMASGRSVDARDTDQEVNFARQRAMERWFSGKALKVEAAGRDYVAYVRPLAFPAETGLQVNATGCSAETGDSSAGTGITADQFLQGQCAVVGLVRTEVMQQRTFGVSLDMLTGAALLLALVIVLVPVIKLRFLGAGAITRMEVGAALFGLVAATALATLAAILLWRWVVDHGRAEAMLQASALSIARDFDAEMVATLKRPFWVAGMDKSDVPQPFTRDVVCERQAPDDRVHTRLKDGPEFGPAVRTFEPDILWLPKNPAAPRGETRAWPARYGLNLVGELGFGYPMTRPVAHRCNAGARIDVSTREYMKKAVRNEFDGQLPEACHGIAGRRMGRGYAIEAVRSRTDGVPSLAVASRLFTDANAAGSEPTLEPCPWASALPTLDKGIKAGSVRGPLQGVAIQSIVPLSLLAPVLPPGLSFVVVDASKPDLPYLFGSQPGRIGIDRLGDSLGNGLARDVIARLQAERPALGGLASGSAEPDIRAATFVAGFEGEPHHFAAAALPGTGWVILLHQPVQSVDQPLAAAARYAVLLWLGLGLIAVLLAWFVRLLRKDWWEWLWARPQGGPAARMAGIVLMLLAGGATLLLAASVAGGLTRLTGAMVLLILLAPLAVLPATRWWLKQSSSGAAMAAATGAGLRSVLRPRDERGYRAMHIGLLMLLGMATMAALWADAWADTRDRQLRQASAQLESSWKGRDRKIDDYSRGFGLEMTNLAREQWQKELDAARSPDQTEKEAKPEPQPEPDPPCRTGQRLAGFHGLHLTDVCAKVETSQSPLLPGGIAEQVREWEGEGPRPRHASCAGVTAPGTIACLDASGKFGMTGWQPDGRAPWSTMVAIVLVLLLLLILLRSALWSVHRGLFGFGVPLEAVEYPKIAHNEPGSPREMILNAPLALELHLRGDQEALDLALALYGGDGTALPALLSQEKALRAGGTIVVTSLDVALKDPALRPGVLRGLERLVTVLDHEERTCAGAFTGRIVVLTDLAPLDRILQAYEREMGEGGEGISNAEQLRWSRLFEDFSCYSLPIVAKFHWDEALQRQCREALEERFRTYPGVVKGILTLIGEMRWLTEEAIDSVLPGNDRPMWKEEVGRITEFPIDPDVYHRIYFDRIVKWAAGVAPASPEAAVDFLRGMMIEHYQHRWAASSHAERVIMDALARDRMINLESSLAMRSLVRRGLVRLDPRPALMNDSFARFVEQAERPDTIAGYRREQGKSLWDRAAIPLAVILPMLLIGISVLAVIAGQSVSSVLPVVLSAGPALIGAAASGLRRG